MGLTTMTRTEPSEIDDGEYVAFMAESPYPHIETLSHRFYDAECGYHEVWLYCNHGWAEHDAPAIVAHIARVSRSPVVVDTPRGPIQRNILGEVTHVLSSGQFSLSDAKREAQIAAHAREASKYWAPVDMDAIINDIEGLKPPASEGDRDGR